MLGLSKKIKIHFVGIGGIGMSGIAEVLLSLGYPVSGSDIANTATTLSLQKNGAEIHLGHQESNLENAGLVVYSSAIDGTNPEIQRAKRERIPLVRRAEMLAELMRLKYGIAIAGSHGKTTTTSMVATIFHDAGKDPTHIIGGVVSNLGGHAKKGDGEFLIAEADESDGSFLHLNPIMAVVTNIDNDHLDFHKTEENIRKAFTDFINRLPFYGKVALNAHDAGTKKIMDFVKRPYVLFGIARGLDDRVALDYSADKVIFQPGHTEFDLWSKGSRVGRIVTQTSGEHNVLNALAAIAISHESGLTFPQIIAGLAKFQGVGRRLERLWQKNGFEVIDDYGHHPTEIRATLATLKNVFKKPICVVFEPHRYSRTQQLWQDFVDCFSDADEVFVGPIYAASEAAIPGITSEKLVLALKAKVPHTTFLPNLDKMRDLIVERQNKDMVFLTLGAGSISKKAKAIVQEL
jgi:UDP-N-acetylmuramate--alanine ligase